MVSGFDLQMNYKHALPGRWGSLSASLKGAYLWHETTTPYPGSGTFDCAGLFDRTYEQRLLCCSRRSTSPSESI